MTGNEDIVEPEQGIVAARRLCLQHIQASAGN